MKLLISLISALTLIFISVAVSHAATVTTVTTVTKTTAAKHIKHAKHIKQVKKHKQHCCKCPTKPKKRHKISHPVTVYYTPGYCVPNACSCSGVTCYPGRYYQCKTEYYYHQGRNSARVEVCY